MHEERLELTLGKVQHAHEECELLQLCRRTIGAVDQRASQIHEGVNQERAEIFHDEDCPPGDLGAYMS